MAKQEKKRKESGERGGYIRPMIYPELRSQPEQYRGQRRHGYPHERKLVLHFMLHLRRELPLHQGGSNFACGANYPHQALKGGYFVFVWRVGT